MWREILESPIGRIYVEADEEGITGVGTMRELGEIETGKILGVQEDNYDNADNVTNVSDFLRSLHLSKNADKKSAALVKEACRQLTEYFAGKRTAFDIPLHEKGTAFQKQVWQALREIPYGETRSYGQIAERIGNPKASRAVGMANHHNPILIITPCHRVIGADGRLTGFGSGLPAKQALLEIEGIHSFTPLRQSPSGRR